MPKLTNLIYLVTNLYVPSEIYPSKICLNQKWHITRKPKGLKLATSRA